MFTMPFRKAPFKGHIWLEYFNLIKTAISLFTFTWRWVEKDNMRKLSHTCCEMKITDTNSLGIVTVIKGYSSLFLLSGWFLYSQSRRRVTARTQVKWHKTRKESKGIKKKIIIKKPVTEESATSPNSLVDTRTSRRAEPILKNGSHHPEWIAEDCRSIPKHKLPPAVVCSCRLGWTVVVSTLSALPDDLQGVSVWTSGEMEKRTKDPQTWVIFTGKQVVVTRWSPDQDAYPRMHQTEIEDNTDRRKTRSMGLHYGPPEQFPLPRQRLRYYNCSHYSLNNDRAWCMVGGLEGERSGWVSLGRPTAR